MWRRRIWRNDVKAQLLAQYVSRLRVLLGAGHVYNTRRTESHIETIGSIETETDDLEYITITTQYAVYEVQISHVFGANCVAISNERPPLTAAKNVAEGL